MKKIFLKGFVFLAIFSFIALPIHNSIAEEIDGVAGNSYLTFLFMDCDFDLDIFTFEADGTFIMERKDGDGNYEYNAPIFEAEWKSADETTTYNFTGLSLVGSVIIGWENETISSRHHGDWGINFFVGIRSNLIPD